MSQLAATGLSLVLASIWLGACLVVAVTLSLRALPEMTARWRYRIWLGVLLATLAGPGLVVVRSQPRSMAPPPTLPVVSEEAGASGESAIATASSETGPRRPVSPTIEPGATPSAGPASGILGPGRVSPSSLVLSRQMLVLVSAFLLLGAVISLLRIPFQLTALGRLKRRAAGPSAGLLRLWQEALQRLPTSRRLRVLVSADVSLPVACGYFQPAVLVPQGLSTALTDEETRHLLLHELAHLVRRDDWGLLSERLIRAVCWWHPAVWWIGTRLEQEREEACDELVAGGSERRSYARTLVHLAEISKARPDSLAPGALRGQLTRRVEALLSAPRRNRRLALRLPSVVLAGSALVAGARVSPPRVGALMPVQDSLVEPAQPANKITVASLDSIFSAYADSGFSGTILLARRGRILLQKGYGLADRERGIPATADTRYSTAGMTKLFTAAALLELAEQGKLTLQDSASRWIESLSGVKGAVTLDELLTYRDGLTRLNAPVQRDDREGFVQAVSLSPASFTPGTSYRYSDHGHSLLGLVIEKASGEEYESYIHRRFLQPAGLTRTGFENEGGPIAVEYSGPADALQPVGPRAYRWGRRASLGLVSTAGDLYRWFQELSDSTVVSPAVRRQLFQVRTRTDYNTDQAYGLELVDRGQGHHLWRRVAGTPGFEGELIHDPENDWTAVILVNTRLGWRFRVWREIERAMWQPEFPNPSS